MPKRLGVEVNVTDTHHNTFTEYSLQPNRRFTGKRPNFETFIEAKNGIQFLIQVTVDNPFKFEEDLTPVAKFGATINKQEAPVRQVTSEHNTRTKHFDDNRPAEEELGGLLIEPSAASTVPFDLMVSIFIDGRAKPECRQMIYLDHKHPRYDARCVLKGRWVDVGDASSRDGKAGLLQWVFSDRGVDHILGQLNVKKVLDKADTDVREAQFKTICGDFGEGLFEDPEDKIMKVGQIEVRVRRVVVQESENVEQKFKAYHYAGCDEKPRDIHDDCTHTTSFMPKTAPAGPGKIETFALRHVAWAYYKKGEDFWSKFIFNYTARHKLVNLGLSRPDGTLALRRRMQPAEPDPSSKRGKKRASSIDGESLEQAWAEGPIPRKTSRSISTVKNSTSMRDVDAESETSEEDPGDTYAYTDGNLRAQGRYEMRPTQARVENYKKAKVEDDSDQIS